MSKVTTLQLPSRDALTKNTELRADGILLATQGGAVDQSAAGHEDHDAQGDADAAPYGIELLFSPKRPETKEVHPLDPSRALGRSLLEPKGCGG